MRTGDDDRNDGRDDVGLKERTNPLPEAPRTWPSAQQWLVILGTPVVLLGVLWLFAESHVQELRDGQTATVIGAGGCREGGGHAGPPPSCHATWQFPDGHTSSGTVPSSSVVKGDTVFAGEGWAYPSAAPVWQLVGIFSFIAASVLVVNVAIWVVEFRQDRQRRTYELRYGHEYLPDPGDASAPSGSAA
ncbi:MULTISPECIES: hypothetical protein [unclassified Streptomyces]|uniref:hypothetical protein n=1 Tax=unclassified Streptomyces TaxID=2593676 RepID=UPI0009A0DAD3|nr:hypothetical protein [Streptomyces sp. TSRI0281]